MKVTSAKKLSRMTPEEMAQEALSSPNGAERVAQYLRAAKGWDGAISVWEAMAKSPEVFSHKTVSDSLMAYLATTQPYDRTTDLLYSYLSIHPDVLGPMATSLNQLAHRYPDSDYAAIMLLAPGTPGETIMHIAQNWGMHQKADHKETQKREALLKKMLHLISNGVPLKNEISGALFGSLLKKNSNDPLATAIVGNSSEFPRSFQTAVFEHGSTDLKDIMTAKSVQTSNRIDDVSAYFSHADGAEMKKQIFDMSMANQNFNVAEKVLFIRHVIGGGWSASSPETDDVIQHVAEVLSESRVPEFYEIAVEMLERGNYFDVDAITGNVNMAMGYCDRIWAAVKNLGREDDISDGFRTFLEFMGGEGYDPEEEWTISSTWYGKYRGS